MKECGHSAGMAGADRPAKLRRLCECFAMSVAGDPESEAGLAGKTFVAEDSVIGTSGIVGFMLGHSCHGGSA